MATNHLHLYRRLLREINCQYTSVNGNRAWAAQLRSQWMAASKDPASANRNMLVARNVLAYLMNNRKHSELITEFYPKMSEGDRIEKTARRVGLEAPSSFNET
ncbi:hypothetical protein EV183_003605, partial [Coemansia sp. RSA 2336]